jgi:peroxiredoxin family protein
MVVFSGDMDRLMAAFIIATGAAASGTDVTMFFTFYGLQGIKKPSPPGAASSGACSASSSRTSKELALER